MRIFNTNEEPIDVGRLSSVSSILVLRKNGRTYLGDSGNIYVGFGRGFITDFDRISVSYMVAQSTESNVRVWYELGTRCSALPLGDHHRPCMLVKFRTQVGVASNGLDAKHYDVIFDEFVQ